MSRYSDILMDHFTLPRNQGRLEAPDALGLVGTPGDGPFLLLALRVTAGVVNRAAFQNYGCGPTIAAGSLLTKLILGKPLAECRTITAETLTVALGGVPPDKAYSPALAVGALQAALDYLERRTAESRGPEPASASERGPPQPRSN